MPLPDFAFNPDARIATFAVGHARSPVIVIDDAFADPQAIANYGRTEAAFGPPPTAYPGLNAPVPPQALQPLLDALRPALAGLFPENAPLGTNGYFGLVTLAPATLAPGQTIPHVDNVGDRGLAAVAYLCDPDQGGTGFYRHRATGFERLTRDTIATYNAALDFEMRQPRAAAYPVGDHTLFECIGATEARFNRLTIYNCNLLHSGQVNPERLSADPTRGRLTLNLFIAPV